MQLLSHWIGGEPYAPENRSTFDVLNPIDDSVYCQSVAGTSQDIELAVDHASEVFNSYRKSTPENREHWLRSLADNIDQNAASIVDVLIDEVGSPISKARQEIATSTRILRAAAGAARQLSGKTLPSDVPGRLSISKRQPLGVIAGITPFNVPLIKCIKHLAMPLATGNTVVLLPSEEAPSIARMIAHLSSEAGFPSGALNVVLGSGYEIGDSLSMHPKVRMVGFTGSCRVGAHIAEVCGKLRKRVLLEMGGKNPLIVLEDADIDAAVRGALIGSFLFSGQICMASSRLIVSDGIYDSFMERFLAAAQSLAAGDLRDPRTMIGPIISERQRSRIRNHLHDAKSKGARVHCGDQWIGNACLPTVLTDVTSEMQMHHEETFGPTTCVYRVKSSNEALNLANDTRFGLSASLYTQNLDDALVFTERLDAGMVHINGTTIQEEPHVPFGGTGESGMGRESTDVSIDSFTEWKWITIQGPTTAAQ